MYGTSGLLPFRTTLDHLHRDLLLGNWGRFYSELAASWLAILIFTGLYQWIKRRKKNIKKIKKPFTTNSFKNIAPSDYFYFRCYSLLRLLA